MNKDQATTLKFQTQETQVQLSLINVFKIITLIT